MSIERLNEFLGSASRLFVLTGAGCSTDSGIPDYRDAAGQWKRKQPVTHQAFLGQDAVRRRYWARSLIGWPIFSRALPNTTHAALARLERLHKVQCLVTQNVDRLHQHAGSRNVIDLHGRLDQVVCTRCPWRAERREWQPTLEACNPGWADHPALVAPDGDADLEGVDFARFVIPDCPACSGIVKPDVVFFGDSVPRPRVEEAMAHLQRADGVLVVGSSLMVMSGFRFVRAASQQGLPIVAVNLGQTRAESMLAFRVAQPCAEVFGQWTLAGQPA